MDSHGSDSKWLIRFAIQSAFGFLLSYYLSKKLMSMANPNHQKEEDAKKRTKKLFEGLDLKGSAELSEHETLIASQLVGPTELNTSWKDIAGLNAVLTELYESVSLPLSQISNGYSSSLLQPPKGILLHGPPGCGKTMVAKAVAAESGLRFINLDISTLTDKYFGESQKLCTALFSVAKKVSPCIIFIDEIDSFLRTRNSVDNETTAMMKSLFLQNWDGLCTDDDTCVIIMGATNRRQDVDNAFMRRMPIKIQLPLPGFGQRLSILRVILRDEEVGDDVDLEHFAKLTSGFSGSDLKELCRAASIQRLKNLPRSSVKLPPPLGAITQDQMLSGLQKILKSK